MPSEQAVENQGVEEVSGNTAEVDIFLSQGIEGPSEAELRGEDINQEAKTTESEPEVKVEEEVKANESEEETETTEENTANSEPKVEKTPKGFVPLAAVHEARGEIRYLKEQVAQMQEQLKAASTPKSEVKDVGPEFEVLSDEDFEDLAEDNPAQAAIYLRQLSAYESQQRAKADEERRQAEFAQAYDNIIDTSVAEIEKIAPGIFDEDSTVQKELMEFADTLGFSEDLYYLTNPSTKIILPGETEPLLLGEQAATILGVLVNAKTKTKAPDTSKLEAKLREEITAEVMKKFKNSSESYRGLNQVPKAQGGTPEPASFADKVLTTEQLLKLSPAEYEAYLAGN